MDVLTRKRGHALWDQIYTEISQEITGGKLSAGARLPTEIELMERFGVSRHTIRRAMAELERHALIRVEQGRGTFVHHPIIHYQLGRKTSYTENLLKQGRESRRRTISVEEVRLPAEIARLLGQPARSEAYLVTSYSTIDSESNEEVVIAVGRNYYSKATFPDLPTHRRRFNTMQAVYREYGIADYQRLKTWIGTRFPDEEEARLLRQSRSRPVLVTRKLDGGLDGRPLCYGDAVWSGDLVEFVVDRTEL